MAPAPLLTPSKRYPWGDAAAVGLSRLRAVYFPDTAAATQGGVTPAQPQQHQGILYRGRSNPIPTQRRQATLAVPQYACAKRLEGVYPRGIAAADREG